MQTQRVTITSINQSNPAFPRARVEPIRASAPLGVKLQVTELGTRDELLIKATQQFCSGNVTGQRESDLYKEAFYALIDTAAEGTLATISKMLSQNSLSPRACILYLAAEPVSVSAPVLRNAKMLGQLDMIGIIEKSGAEHACILASRADIGPTVIKHLEKLNDAAVRQALESNQTIVYSASGQRTNVRTVVAPKAEAAAPAEKPPVAATSKLLEAAARGGRISVEENGKGRPTKPQAKKDELASFGPMMEKTALTRARQGMAITMNKHFQLTLETCHRVLEDKSGQTLAVLLKAADLDDALANRITLLTFPSLGLSIDNTCVAIAFYKQLEKQACLEAVSQWPKVGGNSAVHVSYSAESEADQRRAVKEGSVRAHRASPTEQYYYSKTG